MAGSPSGPGQAPTALRNKAPVDDYLADAERQALRKAREYDATMFTYYTSETDISMIQQAHTSRLQKALRALPLEVILNHINIALDERSDFDLEQAQRFASMINDKVWRFY